MTMHYDCHAKEKHFKSDDLVLKKVDIAAHQNALGKLTHNWDGLFIIKEQFGQQQSDSGDVSRTWSTRDLKKFYS